MIRLVPASTVDRAATLGLELVRAGVRKVPPERRAWLSRRCKPAFDRAMARVARSDLRNDERALLASIATDPENGALWYELALCQTARQRHRKASHAFVMSAVHGARLSRVTIALLRLPSVRRYAGAARNLERMRSIANASQESAERQLLVGAFMLDQGRLAEGRELVQRGYELQRSGESDLLDTDGDTDGDGSQLRTGPNFLILGPPKTGSTSLYAFLAEHPQVIPTPRKELHFWTYRYGRSPEIYEAYFPRHLPPGFMTGEASVNLLTTPLAAPEIGARYPAVKAIVLHREPVARAYSDYQMRRRELSEDRPFEVATAYEMRRIGDSPPLDGADRWGSSDHYLIRSCILPFLRAWVDALGPEQVMVVDSAELSSNRRATIEAVHDFLDLPTSNATTHDDRNVHAYDPLPGHIEERLRDWFAPHEAALGDYLAANQLVVRFPRD